MHLHLHLKDCILDFGPIYAFWLFSFERYNGILGDIPTNNRNVELQLMNRFTRDNYILNLPIPEVEEDFYNLRDCCTQLFEQRVNRGTLNDLNIIDISERSFWGSRNFDVRNKECWTDMIDVVFPRKFTILNFSDLELNHLAGFYRHLYPEKFNELTISPSAWKTTEVFRDGKDIFAGSSSRSFKSSYVQAFWSTENGDIASFNQMPLKPTPGQVQYILKHTVFYKENPLIHTLAYVSWFLEFESKEYYGKPVEVWHRTLCCPRGPASFIPIRRLHSKFVNVQSTMNGHNVMIVLPRSRSSLNY